MRVTLDWERMAAPELRLVHEMQKVRLAAALIERPPLPAFFMHDLWVFVRTLRQRIAELEMK
jgi:hypothetical protein